MREGQVHRRGGWVPLLGGVGSHRGGDGEEVPEPSSKKGPEAVVSEAVCVCAWVRVCARARAMPGRQRRLLLPPVWSGSAQALGLALQGTELHRTAQKSAPCRAEAAARLGSADSGGLLRQWEGDAVRHAIPFGPVLFCSKSDACHAKGTFFFSALGRCKKSWVGK